MRHRYLRQIIYVKGRVLQTWKQTGCLLLFRNSSFFLCVCSVFIWTMHDLERELKRGRLKPVHLILSKHRTSAPLGGIHLYTHTHTQSCLHTLTISSLYDLELPWVLTEPRGEEKRLSQANAKLIQLREILQTERSSATVVWERETVIPQVDITWVSRKVKCVAQIWQMPSVNRYFLCSSLEVGFTDTFTIALQWYVSLCTCAANTITATLWYTGVYCI